MGDVVLNSRSLQVSAISKLYKSFAILFHGLPTWIDWKMKENSWELISAQINSMKYLFHWKYFCQSIIIYMYIYIFADKRLRLLAIINWLICITVALSHTKIAQQRHTFVRLTMWPMKTSLYRRCKDKES